MYSFTLIGKFDQKRVCDLSTKRENRRTAPIRGVYGVTYRRGRQRAVRGLKWLSGAYGNFGVLGMALATRMRPFAVYFGAGLVTPYGLLYRMTQAGPPGPRCIRQGIHR